MATTSRPPSVSSPSELSLRQFISKAARDLSFPAILFVLSFAMFLIVRSVTIWGMPPDADCKWDATWYRQIIDQGYLTDGNRNVQHNVVFFPLYPWTCRIAKELSGLPTKQAMLLVSALCTLLAFVFLYKVVLRHLSPRTARASLLLLAFNPYAGSFYNGYTESMFLLLLALFFYFLLNQDVPWAAALSAALASMVRPYGCLLALVLAFELLRRHYRQYGLRPDLDSKFLRQALLWTPVCFAGLVAYTAFLGYRFGEPMAFSHNMIAWGVKPGGSIEFGKFLTFTHILAAVPYSLVRQSWAGPFTVGIAMFILTPVLLFLGRRRLHPTFLFFLLLMFVFFDYLGHHGPTQMVNIGRHLMAIFPFTMLLAIVLDPLEVERYIKTAIADDSVVVPCLCGRFICALPLLMLLALFVWLFARYTVLFYTGVFV